MNWDIRFPTTNIITHITHVVPYVKRERVGVKRRDVFIYLKMTIYFVIIVERV
jgi:hypothetical protein